ncbi:hypothetical protein ABT095_17405 [Kitasatospora sp. NPDC002227]|uniref:hypothetical protein n=1 Tax=Kitasatospora sp. NPDC002227 TaxID=3154773 RepID=UPI00332C8A95
MSGQTRVQLRRVLWDLSDLGEEVDPFAPDSDGAPLFAEIATKAGTAAQLARDLETEAHNTATENGETSR